MEISCWRPTLDPERRWPTCCHWYACYPADSRKYEPVHIPIELHNVRVTHSQVKLLKDQERQGGAAARAKRPRALVLGPTRELTDQILSVAKSISHHAKFRSACINGGEYLGLLFAVF